MNFILIVTSVLLNAVAQLFLKKGMLVIGNVDVTASAVLAMLPKVCTNIFVWGGFGCYTVSIILWLIVLSKVEVSYAYPFLSIGYIVAAVFGWAVLGESMSAYKITGIAVICLGIVLLYRA